jgi:hypothetical protein
MLGMEKEMAVVAVFGMEGLLMVVVAVLGAEVLAMLGEEVLLDSAIFDRNLGVNRVRL